MDTLHLFNLTPEDIDACIDSALEKIDTNLQDVTSPKKTINTSE